MLVRNFAALEDRCSLAKHRVMKACRRWGFVILRVGQGILKPNRPNQATCPRFRNPNFEVKTLRCQSYLQLALPRLLQQVHRSSRFKLGPIAYPQLIGALPCEKTFTVEEAEKGARCFRPCRSLLFLRVA